MVGEKETSILRHRKDGGAPDEGQQGTYARRKKEKKSAKFHLEEQTGSARTAEDQTMLVDRFVQEVIERAKHEYIRQCSNHHGNIDSTGDDNLLPGNRKDSTADDKGVSQPHDTKKSKKPGSDKHKHRHHYKYSDPVDAKEISAYEQQERSSLLRGTSNFDMDQGSTHRPDHAGIYRQSLSALRRFLGCCVGKS